MNQKVDDSHLQREIEKLANSDEFRILDHHLTQNNARWTELPNKIKWTSIYMLRLGIDDLIPDLWRLLYKHKVPSPEEFLTEEIIGSTARTLYPKWREIFLETYSPRSLTYEVIISGSIGSGKSTAVHLLQQYNLYRLCCLRNPQLTMGAAEVTSLVLSLFSLTLEKVQLATMAPFMAQMKICPIFEEVASKKEFKEVEATGKVPYLDYGRYVDFPNRIMVFSGSTGGHALSFSNFGCVLDEAEFRISSDLQESLNTYTELKERVRSRFLGSRFIMMNMLSSAKYTTGVIAEYVKDIPKDSTYTRFYSFPIWEVKYFDAYSKGHFYVLRGTKQTPSHILDEVDSENYERGEYKPPVNCEVIKVPETYRADFQRRVETALQNLAGVQTLEGEMLFDDTTQIEKKFLIPEFNIVAPMGDARSLLDQFPIDQIFVRTGELLRFARYPHARRYIHADVAEVAEAGLSCGHKEVSKDGKIMMVTDFVCWITSPTRIYLDAIAHLIIDLSEKAQTLIEVFSTDQYQSSHIRQLVEVEKAAKRVEYISVDRTEIPYQMFASVVDDGAFACGRAPKLRGQLHKVQLDIKNKPFSNDRKDMADAVAGWVYTAKMNTADFPSYIYEEKGETSTSYPQIDLEKWEFL